MASAKQSSTYHLFKPAFYYFLLPKKLPRSLKNAINFVANSVFQADQVRIIMIFNSIFCQRDTILLHASVYTRSFADIYRMTKPQSKNAPLSLYSIGIVLLIALSLQFVAIFVFILEIVDYRLKLELRLKNWKRFSTIISRK